MKTWAQSVRHAERHDGMRLTGWVVSGAWVTERTRITRWLLLVAFGIALMSALVKAYEKLIERTEAIRFLNSVFNVNGDGQLAWLFMLVLMVAACVLCGVIVFAARFQKVYFRYYWLMALCVLCALVLMKSTRLFHEVLYAMVDALRAGNGLLIALVGLGAAASIGVGVRYSVAFLSSLSWTVKRQMIVAICVYLIGAVVLEEIGETLWYVTHGANLAYEVLGSVEEFCEMAGFIVLQQALLQFLAEHASTQHE